MLLLVYAGLKLALIVTIIIIISYFVSKTVRTTINFIVSPATKFVAKKIH